MRLQALKIVSEKQRLERRSKGILNSTIRQYWGELASQGVIVTAARPVGCNVDGNGAVDRLAGR
jgi:hypothetical protein